jgi:hypothetical protein
MVGTTEPCPIKGFECGNAQMKSWHILRQECLLSVIGVLGCVRLWFVDETEDVHLAIQGRCWHETILHLWAWAHVSYHILQSLVLPNKAHQQKHWHTMENKWWTWIFVQNLLRTFFFLSAQSSMKYIDDHRTFISSISWTVSMLFALIWTVLHISFCFDDEHFWPAVSNDIFFSGEVIICTLTMIALTNPTSSRDVGTCASGCFGLKCGDLL